MRWEAPGNSHVRMFLCHLAALQIGRTARLVELLRVSTRKVGAALEGRW